LIPDLQGFRTIANVGDAEFTVKEFFIAFGEFVKIFFGSLGIGTGIALLMALVSLTRLMLNEKNEFSALF